MKKILLGTTAIIALSTFSAEAFAAEKIKLELGGFMRHYVGVGNSDETAVTAGADNTARDLGLGMHGNTEIYFRGATTLDNGLNVSVDIQKEANKGASGTDISSVTVSSDTMGAFTIGGTAGADDDFVIRSPHQASDLDWGDAAAYANIAGLAGGDSAAFGAQSLTGVAMDNTKGNKLKYNSPSFGGISAHLSYTPATGVNKDLQSASRNDTHDETAAGIMFEGEMGGASISADVGTLRINGANNQNHFGLNIGMAGFTVGGGYTTSNDDQSTAAAAASASRDGKAYEIGLAYATGPYTIAGGYMKSKSKGVVATVGNNVDTYWTVSGAYDLGAGVLLTANYEKAKTEAEDVAKLATDGSVSAFVAGIEVGF